MKEGHVERNENKSKGQYRKRAQSRAKVGEMCETESAEKMGEKAEERRGRQRRKRKRLEKK